MNQSNHLFRQSSLERISSPDQLNDYIKVSNPSVWIVLAAMLALAAGAAVWAIYGSLPTKISARGTVSAGMVVCYLEPGAAAEVKAGQPVQITVAGQDRAVEGSVAGVGTTPLSASEIAEELNSDYLAQNLASPGFAVKTTITPQSSGLPEGSLISLEIVTAEVRPIDFLWR